MADGTTTATKRRRVRKPRAITTSDPFEIALEAHASGQTPEGVAHEVLRKHSVLLGWQIASERAGLALKLLTGAAGMAAAGVLGWMAWSASQDRSVVIDPLRTPPDLAQQGADGTTLANALQDRLAMLEGATYSILAAQTELTSRPTEVRVQIPTTGISVADLDQALRVWLGHQTHVSGELRRIAAGPEAGALSINVRVGDAPGARFVQADGDVDALLAGAAEHVYAAVEPLRYANWLEQTGRPAAEVDAQLRRVLAGPGPAEQRAIAANWLGSSRRGRDVAERRRLLMEAMRLSGGRVGAQNLGGLENRLGRTEIALDLMRKELRQGTRGVTERGRFLNELNTKGGIAALTGDFQVSFGLGCELWQVRPCSSAALVKQVLARPERLDPAGDPDAGQRNLRTATAARYLALLHEPGAARRIANLGAGRAVMPTAQANWAEARIEAARQLEDWPDVLAQLELRQAIDFEPTLLFEAYAALAHAKLGNSPAAWAVEARLPADCYRCQYVLAMAHEAMGDRTGADRRFAEAARQGPSLAWAETEWARVFVARGDAKAAIVQAKRAQKKAPKWADPLEAWGEALLMQGDAEGAASKFALAQKLTPRWGRLHLKWGEALAAQGEMDEARAKWRAAAGMDLSPGDRSRLESLLRQRTT